MKKFLVFLILVGGGVAAWWYYDPYLKPYVGPIIEKLVGKPLPEKSEEPPSPDTPETPGTVPLPTPGTSEKEGGMASKPKSTAPGKAPSAAPKGPAQAKAPQVSQSEIDRIVNQRYPMPQIIPLRQIVGNWTTIPPRAFPEKVQIKDRLPFSLRSSSGKVIGASVAAPGTLVKPVRLQGRTLTVASMANSSMRSQIDIDKTDLKKRIEKRYNDFVFTTTNRIRLQREKAKRALMAKPETVAAIQEARTFDESGDPRFAPVKASLAKGAVKGFSLEEATAFRWNGKEKINGDIHKGTFETVTVKYLAKTIFGEFPGEAKCLLSNGTVIGWIDPITEDEMI